MPSAMRSCDQCAARAVAHAGPCAAHAASALAQARSRPTEGRGPAARTPRMGCACRCMGAHAISYTQEGRHHGPCGPMRGPCGARLAWARCGPSGRVIPAARAPRPGPACRCMGGAPAGIAALADTYSCCCSAQRARACSRSVHVNMGCVISSYESINSSPSLVVLLTRP